MTPHPLLYEVNTRCWLRELSQREGRPVTLASVPDDCLDTWQQLGPAHLWLMGVWPGGPRARRQALDGEAQRRAYTEALPDWQETDVAGSPYAVAGYEVSAELGGEAGLQLLRQRLRNRGMKLVLDFVPNHVGLDHPWVREQPGLFVQSPVQRKEFFSQETRAGVRWLAHGKDPNFSAWTDTVQLDYRLAITRQQMSQELLRLAARCDAVRCDMAMLVLKDVFANTWASFPVESGVAHEDGEFWTAAIQQVKAARPDFVFLAEAYWGLEPRLQALGFDYTYDKELYDGLVARQAGAVQRHLLELPPAGLAAGAHFLENHDEPRIASRLSFEEHRAAAVLILGLPGMRFLHEGQLSGARIRVPVQLARRCAEPEQPEIRRFYERLLQALRQTAVGQGSWQMIRPREAWAGNPSAQNIVLVLWQDQGTGFALVAVNLAPHPSQCFAPLEVVRLAESDWLIRNLLGAEAYPRSGSDLQTRGLYLDLPAHTGQLLQARRQG